VIEKPLGKLTVVGFAAVLCAVSPEVDPLPCEGHDREAGGLVSRQEGMRFALVKNS
jgi:hypothetical protein